MNFNVTATLRNGALVFNGTMGFVPRVGEEIETCGMVFVVENVRYIFNQGRSFGQSVRLTLRQE